LQLIIGGKAGDVIGLPLYGRLTFFELNQKEVTSKL
jgi:hypothetical protein